MSRSLVGSSSTRTLAGRANRRASSSRLRSPPDSDFTGDMRALAREQEVGQIADDVPRLAVDDDDVVAVVDGVGDGAIGIELLALLIEVGDLEPRASADLPASGSSSPTSSRSSVVLPEPFGPMRPTRSPRRIRCE